MENTYNEIYRNLKNYIYIDKKIFCEKNRFKLNEKYDKDELKRNFEAGKALMIYSLLDITDEFFERNDNYFSKIKGNLNKEIKEYSGENNLSSVDLSNEILNSLSYKNWEELEKGDLYRYIRDNSKKYSHFFILGFKYAYQFIDKNKVAMSEKIRVCEYKHIELIQNNIRKMNYKDLEIKCNIIKQEFSNTKLQFIIKNKNLKEKENILKEIIRIEEELAEISILSISENGMCRSWIGYYLEEKECKYNLLNWELESGVLAIVYFYIKLYEITKDEIYLKIIKEAINIENMKSAIGSNINLIDLKFILKKIGGNHLREYGEYSKKMQYIKSKSKYVRVKKELDGYYLVNNKYKCLVGAGGIVTYGLRLIEEYEKIVNN